MSDFTPVPAGVQPPANPLKRLLHSRKALIAVFSMVVATVTYFVGKYASPSIFEDVKFLLIVTEPTILIWIGAIAYEDAAEKSNSSSL